MPRRFHHSARVILHEAGDGFRLTGTTKDGVPLPLVLGDGDEVRITFAHGGRLWITTYVPTTRDRVLHELPAREALRLGFRKLFGRSRCS